MESIMSDAANVRSDIASYFRDKAQWRLDVAKDRCSPGSCGELKNERYAWRLEQVAKYVEALPDDDSSLAPLLAAWDADFTSRLSDMHQDDIHCNVNTTDEIAAWFPTWVSDAIKTA